jgi:hypothetical protein
VEPDLKIIVRQLNKEVMVYNMQNMNVLRGLSVDHIEHFNPENTSTYMTPDAVLNDSRTVICVSPNPDK